MSLTDYTGSSGTQPSNTQLNPTELALMYKSGYKPSSTLTDWSSNLVRDGVNLNIGDQPLDFGTGVPTGNGGGPGFWSLEGMFGGKDGGGWVAPVAQIGLGAYQAYLGSQNLELARENSDRQWAAWGLQYDNQRNLVNEQLASRQMFRNANGGVASGDVNTFLKDYGAKARPGS